MEDKYAYFSYVIERELDEYIKYISENTKDHHIEKGDEDMIKKEYEKYDDIELDEIAKQAASMFLVPNWFVIFHADNHLDSGKKSLEQQRELIGAILADLRTTGNVSSTNLPDAIVKVINEEFLTEPLKVQALISELTAEYNLCDPTIGWKDAMKERIRVACYSVLLCVNPDILGTIAKNVDRISEITQEDVEWLKKYGDRTSLDETLLEKMKNNIKEILAKSKNGKKFADVLETVESGEIPAELKGTPRLSEYELIQVCCIVSICMAISDDFLDIAEDLENNKITGITRGLDENIPAEHIFKTTNMYFMLHILKSTHLKENVKVFLYNLVNVYCNDPRKCIEIITKKYPVFLSYVFQRVNTTSP